MLSNLNQLVQPILQEIKDFKSLDCELPDDFKTSVSQIGNNTIEYGKYNTCATNADGQKIFISNTWFYIAAILAPLYKPFIEYRATLWSIVPKDILKTKNKSAISNIILKSGKLSQEDRDLLIKFATEPSWWNGGNYNDGKSLDRGDCLNSAILSIANVVNVSQGYITDLWEFLGKNPQYALLLAKSPIHSLTPIKHSAPLQKIFFGSPGTGKSFSVKTKVLNGIGDEFIFRTTFHPDSDYASFVGCYKPRMDGGKIEYAFTPQVFTKAYCKAWKNPERQVYLVIEELNRGNCAQIFGDLFQLLDRSNGVSEYPIDADEDMKAYLETALKDTSDGEQDGSEGIAGGKLRLPANFNIVATMNTSDQSLFPMDSAFKRRWDWAYVPTKSSYNKNWKVALDYEEDGTDAVKSKINTGENTYIWSDFLEAINKRILSATHSEDKQLGFWFATPKQGDDISISEFVSKVVFYLWNDVFKDMGPKESNPFTITGENGEKTVMNFNSFFEDNKYGETVESLGAIHTFFRNLGLTPKPIMQTAAGTETTEDDTSEDSAE